MATLPARFTDISAEQARHEKAFRLVDPGVEGAELAERGIVCPSDAKSRTWRDEICTLVTDEELEAAGVTIDEVARAVAYFTATEAKVTRERIAGLPWVRFLEAQPGYLVRAVGYRNGPAGP